MPLLLKVDISVVNGTFFGHNKVTGLAKGVNIFGNNWPNLNNVVN